VRQGEMWKLSLFIITGTFLADIIFKLPSIVMYSLLGFGIGIQLTAVICMYDKEKFKENLGKIFNK
jgi:hypothetical protein